MEKQVTEQKLKFPTETVDLPSKGLIHILTLFKP